MSRENALHVEQIGLRSKATVAMYQGELEFSPKQWYERRDLYLQRNARHKQLVQQLRDEGKLGRRTTAQYKIEAAMKNNGMAKEFYEWVTHKSKRNPWIPRSSILVVCKFQPSSFHSLWRIVKCVLEGVLLLMDYEDERYKSLVQKFQRLGAMDHFQIYKSAQKYLEAFHMYVFGINIL